MSSQHTPRTSGEPPQSPSVPGTGDGDGLQAGLKNRHLSMIAIGGVIGAGLFIGSKAGIADAGPGILLSYALAGLLVVLVMRMLGEMAAAQPTSGSFSTYADRALGRWAGFTIGWLYWFFWSVVLAVEATAAAEILEGWAPAVPQWGWALLVMLVLTGTNLISVGSYGEFEFWFAGIKVVAIIAFIVVGVIAFAGLPPADHFAGTENLTGHGGFLPHGPGAILSGMLLVVFSFMGSEIVTLAAAESPNPVDAVRKAVNSVIWRIGLFYIGSIFVIVSLLPWDSKAIASEGPYVAVLNSLDIPYAGTVMDVVVLTAVLSCLNSGLYTASRMAFSLGERKDAPASFGRTNGRGVPTTAILASVAFGFVAVFFNYIAKDTVFEFLLNSSGAVALFVWLVICASQLRMRRRIEREAPEKLTVRMWLYPYLTWATIGLIVFVIGYMFTDEDGRIQMILSLAVAAVVLAASLVKDRIVRQRGEPLPGPSGEDGTGAPSGEDGTGPDAAAAARVPKPAGEADRQATRR
ncbi:amino acid permease [Streptomyces sp. NPDC006992]|uniref:amino acid permease n=1 Tax=unclassified Streptomyces TaxID=2593676 RepID=UPI0034117AFE